MLLLSGAVRDDEAAFGDLIEMRFGIIRRHSQRFWNLRLGLPPRIVRARVDEDDRFTAVEPPLVLSASMMHCRSA